MTTPAPTIETIANLCKRRGFVFPGSEIYGGVRSTWDYGPLGVQLKRNIKDAWWRDIVRSRPDVVGLDSAILMSPRVWETSGHLASFTDPLVECRSCHERFRPDAVADPSRCPSCGGSDLTDQRQFNLMFKTFVGPVESEASAAWLRPETAQGIFVNFASVQSSMRLKLPFGVAQIGKSFRNEITPGNFVYRTREFEQMEMEWFCEPADAPRWHDYWIEQRVAWYRRYGIRADRLRVREHASAELSHYSSRTVDIEYRFGIPDWGELEGIANRGSYDLTKHSEASGKDLSVFDEATGRRIVPHVIEPAAGADRAALAFLMDAYRVEETTAADGSAAQRVLLALHPKLAPVTAAVLPLSKDARLVARAQAIASELRGRWTIDEDASGSIGRRYRRQDEAGTPVCVTVDFETPDDGRVTVRDRDTTAQERVAISEVEAVIAARIGD